MTEKVDDLTENVARAICDASGGCKYFGPVCKTGRCDVSPEESRAAIRAVLDGIREPDDAMKKAGKLAGDVDDLDHTPSEIEAIFAAMIDELRRRYD